MSKKKKLIVVSSVLASCLLFSFSACDLPDREDSEIIEGDTESISNQTKEQSPSTEQSTQEQLATIRESTDDFIVSVNNVENLKCVVRFGTDNFAEETYLDGKEAQDLYQILISSKVQQELYTLVSSFDRNKVITLDFYTGEWKSFENITQKPLSEFYGCFGLYSEGYLNCSASIYTSFSKNFQIPEETYDAVIGIVGKYR